MTKLLSTVAGRVGRTIHAGWRAVRHPAGWYDEINAVYGRDTKPSGTQSAATAAVGGMIAGGGGGI